ncbi:M48 family metalloprotease [Micromonospora sp. NPDC047074]|uniref:M48 family metalloprotease n=1 Tax=Micromonospora sp. NPDC047074 TaxID=3154339 RepID=UPI0033E1D09C
MTGPVGVPGAGPVRSPDRLAWCYLLVLAALVAVGIGAGDLFFLADRSLHLPWALALDACDRAFGAGVAEPAPPGFTDCMAGPARQRGLVMLGAVGVVLACAAALLVLVPSVDLWRLRRHRGRFTVAPAAARFAALCDDNGLSGRDRPRLLIAGPPVRQAFTVGVVGRRPVVVLPAGVAVAYRDPLRFDPVVQHELAHVRARDVVWVSAARGLVWLPVPAVAVGGLLEIGTFSPNAIVGATFLRALLLSVLVAVLAAALLRAREREADLHVVRAGQAQGLTALLHDASTRERPAGNGAAARLRRLLARHPSPRDRAASLRDRERRPTGDLARGVAAGAVALVTMGAVHDLSQELHYAAQGWLPPLVDVWVGAVLLVGVLMPSLLRRAASARRDGVAATWLRPVTGTAIGFFVAAFGTAWRPFPGGGALFQDQDAAGALVCAVVAAALGAGAVGLCVVVATALVDARTSAGDAATGPVGGRWWRYAGHAAAIGVTAAVLWPLPVLPPVWADPAVVRAWLVYLLPATGWLLPALALPLLLAARSWPAGSDLPRRAVRSMRVRAVVLAVLVCGVGAVLRARLDPPATLDEALRAAQARWLLCALVGWGVLLVTASGAGRWPLARSVLAAGVATASCGIVQFVDTAAAGRGADALAFRLAVGAPLVWLLYLTTLTTPLLLLAPKRTVSADTAVRVRPGGGVLVGTALAAVLLTAVVLGPGVPGSYAPLPVAAGAATVPRPQAQPSTPASGPTPTSTPAGPGTEPSAGDLPVAGRRLTAAEARAAVRAVRPALPRTWRAQEPAAAGQQRIEPAACVPLARDAFLKVIEPGVRARAEAKHGTSRGRVVSASTTVTVTVTSYADVVSGAVFAAADAARAACPRFTAEGVRFGVRAKRPPALGEQSWRVDYALSVGSGRQRLTGTTAVVLVRVGHNLVTVSMTAVLGPLDERILGNAATAVVRALGR